MSTTAGLREATWHSHQRLEKRLDVKHRFSSLPLYCDHLQRMYGFCRALEHSIEPAHLDRALEDYPARRKLPLLERDLHALGLDGTAVAALPTCTALPACEEPETAFGCLYVLEGATLGGRTLLPRIRSHLGLTAERGATFLASYGTEVDTMWHRFGAALDCWCASAQRSASAARAAIRTFEVLEDWLCGSTA